MHEVLQTPLMTEERDIEDNLQNGLKNVAEYA